MAKPAQDVVEDLWNAHVRDPAAGFARAQALLAGASALTPTTRAWVDLTVGFHYLFFSQPQTDARPWLVTAAAGFAEVGEERGAILARTGLARLLIVERSPEQARAELLAFDPGAVERLAPGDRFWVIDTLGAACFYSQRIDEAIRYLYEALETLRSIDLTPQLPIVMSDLAAALVSVGDYAPACELAWDAIGLLKHYDNPQLLLFARANLAEALFENNDPAGALAVVESILREADPAAAAAVQNHHCAVAAEVLAREGRIDEARRCAARAQDIRERHPGGFNDVHAAWAAAVVADAGNDPERAAHALERALDAATRYKHLATIAKAAERAALRCAQMRDYERAYHYQRVFSQALAERLTNRAGVKFYLLKVQHELQHARAERDRAECERQESAALNRQLEHLNNELTQRMREIERLQARLAAEAVRDPLTELFNRRYLDMVLPGLLSAAARRGSAISVALIDLDHFKRVNDRHGHPVGDRVLTAIGDLFGHSLRPSDLSCRYGGEEFCIVLPDTTAQGAKRAIENLAERLRVLVIDAGAGTQIGNFTFSAGIAEYPLQGRTAPELIAAADRALYAAKAGGRDHVLLAPAAAKQAS